MQSMTRPAPARATSGDILDAYRAHLESPPRPRAESTVGIYLDVLGRMDRELPVGLKRACAEEIRDWINGGDRGDATRALYRTIVAGFFAWATSPWEQRLDFNPAVMIPRPRIAETEPVPVADDQVAYLLRRGGEYSGWFTIAAYGGLRCTELAALERAHVTADHLRIHGKGGKRRTIPTHPEVWRIVQPLPAGPVVRDSRGQRTTRRSVSQRGNKRIHKLGLHDLTMHDLRGWFATKAYIASGYDLEVVRRLLGHASVATTQRYLRFANPARVRAVNGIPVLGAA